MFTFSVIIILKETRSFSYKFAVLIPVDNGNKTSNSSKNDCKTAVAPADHRCGGDS